VARHSGINRQIGADGSITVRAVITNSALNKIGPQTAITPDRKGWPIEAIRDWKAWGHENTPKFFSIWKELAPNGFNLSGGAAPMSDDNKLQPHRPPVRGSNRYAGFKDFKQEITTPPKNEPNTDRQQLFTMTITASIEGERMDEPILNEQFFLEMIYKPNESGLRLRPQETQLLLAYIGEILKEVEIEEQLIMRAEKVQQEQGNRALET